MPEASSGRRQAGARAGRPAPVDPAPASRYARPGGSGVVETANAEIEVAGFDALADVAADGDEAQSHARRERRAGAPAAADRAAPPARRRRRYENVRSSVSASKAGGAARRRCGRARRQLRQQRLRPRGRREPARRAHQKGIVEQPRSRDKARDIAGWLRPTSSPARVTLRRRISASSAGRRLRSIPAKFTSRMMIIITMHFRHEQDPAIGEP